MFTDEITTPARVETLLDVLRREEDRRWTRDAILRLLQPEALPDVRANRPQAAKMLLAAQELGLVAIHDSGYLTLNFRSDQRDTRALLTAALDEQVLGRLDVEPYFAPFYSWLLGLGKEGARDQTNADAADKFRKAYPRATQENPFNRDKVSGLHRWFGYAGLGWYDPRGVFQCDPYERLRRRLPLLFGEGHILPVIDFARRLAEHCPELDGGAIFRAVHSSYPADAGKFTLGVSQALVELHLDGVLRLHCPDDSLGWYIKEANPPRDPPYLVSERVDRVEWLAGRETP